MRKLVSRILAAALVGALAAGCASLGGDGEAAPSSLSWTRSDAEVPAADDRGDLDVADAADEAAQAETQADDAEVRTVADTAPTGQKVIRTAELVLESSDTAETLGRVRALAERAGGYTATSDLQRDDEGVVRGTVTLRVPTEELNAVVDALEELGDAVPVNRIDERDVTVEHADLRARIDNLTTYETELRALLTEIRETTTRPEDLLSVFERIRSVREEIDVLEGRLASLSDRVAFATITVTLRPVDGDGTFEGDEASPWAPGETFREALAATGRLLAALADGLIWFVVTGIPVLISFVGIPALLIYLVVRWLRRRPAPDGGSAPPPPQPADPTAPASPVA
jgi:hypothetical protein